MKKIKLYFLWLSLIILIIFVLQNILGIKFTEALILNERANNGQVWRFVTSIFLHGSIAHLLYNLFALLFFGIVLEKSVGSKRFLWIFLISGIMANLIAINYYDSSLGASGAIYGILGAITIINPFMMVWAFGLMMPMFLASILWVIGDVLRILGVFGPTNIGSIAHISGIIVGILMGMYFRLNKEKVRGEKISVSFDEDNFKRWEEKFVES